MNRKLKTKDLTSLAMFAAVAFLSTVIAKSLNIQFVPSLPFLSYDPKDIILAIASFIYGPTAGLLAISTVAVVEIPISGTGLIGCVMNIISSSAFCVVASFIYSRRRTLSGAVIGLIMGSAVTVVAMLMWNWLITPIYMTTPREAIVQMLIPAFLPFNLLKVTINATATVFLYKPVVTALRKAKLLPPADSKSKGKKLWPVILTMVGAALLFATAVILIITKPF